MLAMGAGCGETAEAIEVRPETISRWRKDPRFAELVSDIINEKMDGARNRLADLVPDALEVLEYAMSPKCFAETRLRAAVAVLKLSGVAVAPRSVQLPNPTGDLFDAKT